ncbi:MAG: ABC transporter ATP-binding protein [Myxococcota bacterium]
MPEPSISSVAIEAVGVDLSFPMVRYRPKGIKEAALSAFRRKPPPHHRAYPVLRGVNLRVERGEVLGLVGKNGSGKSTLLRVLCGIYKPDSGTVRVNGRISALLELGAGFREELTGLENIRLSGAIMGLSATQVRTLIEPIAAFADLGEFLEQPIRTYSSGMRARLGFAVASAVDPEILFIDEALAVGDAGFREKCAARVREMVRGETTVVLVSHSADEIRSLCTRAVHLHDGTVFRDGDPETVLAAYKNSLVGGGA